MISDEIMEKVYLIGSPGCLSEIRAALESVLPDIERPWVTALRRMEEICAEKHEQRDAAIKRALEAEAELESECEAKNMLGDERDSVVQQLAERDKEIERLELDADHDGEGWRKENDHLITQIAERDKEIKSLRATLATFEQPWQKLAKRGKEIEQLRVENAYMKDTSPALGAENVRLQSQLAERDKEIERLRFDNERLRFDKETLWQRSTDAEERLAERSFPPAEIEALLTVSGNGDGRAYFTDDLLSARSRLEKMRDGL